MRFTPEYFAAVAYLFERKNGRKVGEFEQLEIQLNGLEFADPTMVALQLQEMLSSGSCPFEDRRSIYWALGKRFDRSLLHFFRESLRDELRDGTPTVFQVMIALDNLGEPVFDKARTGYGISEDDLNHSDAEAYLARLGW